jgi:guanidinoacetate N-methyltransferase
MHTVNSRKNIGFPNDIKDWAKAEAVYSEHTLRIAGHPVMEDWEINYMEKLANICTSKGGTILELGYGLGLSAKAIQSREIKSHYVIEFHPDVITRCIKDFHSAISVNRLHLLSGFWQDVTPTLKEELFDGILFDTYPLREEEIHSNHFWFFKEAYRLLKPGGTFTYYSDEANTFSKNHLLKLQEAGFQKKNIHFEVCNLNPPKDCEYWQEKTMIAPIITKAIGSID